MLIVASSDVGETAVRRAYIAVHPFEVVHYSRRCVLCGFWHGRT